MKLSKELQVLKEIYEDGEEVSSVSFALFGLSTVKTESEHKDITNKLSVEYSVDNDRNITHYKVANKTVLKVKQKATIERDKSLSLGVVQVKEILAKGNYIVGIRPSGYKLKIIQNKEWFADGITVLTADTLEELRHQYKEVFMNNNIGV